MNGLFLGLDMSFKVINWNMLFGFMLDVVYLGCCGIILNLYLFKEFIFVFFYC